ncbi:2,5-dichloro-2,5-cyclohexadiene-1,4-diol dehydrogenase LinX [Paraburkholderia sacchari]|uniref:SDR family NAD(P)-dependent oxidoreductase n=1 Tax=Paraburkholderia sacchari TaxID=159450 RepID=UPI0039A4EE0E
MRRLEGKTAIVTGAARGMGAAIARLFAKEGATVALCDVSGERAEHQAAEIRGSGHKAFASLLDVTSEESWKVVCAAVIERAGALDILVNNAGVNDRGTIMSGTLLDWERTLRVNLTGPYLGMRAAAEAMRRSGGGAIVNVSSLAAHHGGSQAAYGASKWGLRGLTKIAAMEFVDWNVRVNSVSPAVVETELNAGQPYLGPMAAMTPMGRNGRDIEIANGVLFLASDEASYITGEDLAIDGGFTAGAAFRAMEKSLPSA